MILVIFSGGAGGGGADILPRGLTSVYASVLNSKDFPYCVSVIADGNVN